MAIKWPGLNPRARLKSRKRQRMGICRQHGACWAVLVCVVAVLAAGTARAQSSFDRPGGDYLSAPVTSGDPADCALMCERDRRCHAWSFNYPTDPMIGAVCWLKNTVPARVPSNCCVTGVRGAGVVEPRIGGVEKLNTNRNDAGPAETPLEVRGRRVGDPHPRLLNEDDRFLL